MSYRTYVNDCQIFGNNACYDEWIEFVKTQGVDVDSDYCYEGTIKDVMGALMTIENIVIKLECERRARITKLGIDPAANSVRQFTSLFNLTQGFDDFLRQDKLHSDDDEIGYSLTDKMLDIREESLVFLPTQFIDACADVIERDEPFSTPKHFNCYKLKEGCEIRVEAH